MTEEKFTDSAQSGSDGTANGKNGIVEESVGRNLPEEAQVAGASSPS